MNPKTVSPQTPATPRSNRRDFVKSAAWVTAAVATGHAARAAETTSSDYPYHGRCPAYQPPEILRKKTGLRLMRIDTFTRGSTVAFVRVEADNGKQGWGQVSTYDADLAAALVHRKIAPLFLGRDPADLDTLVDLCIEAHYKWPWSYVCRALAGVETAVWDLLGQHRGQSVCELLGGRPRPLTVYGSSMSRSIQPAEEAIRLAKLRDQYGYRAFKIRVGRVNGHDRDEWPGRTEAIIPAVRKGVGDDVVLLADGNSGFTPPRAIEVGKLMEQNAYGHFEEPCPYWELEWTAQVAQALRLAVAGGEQDNDLAQWRRMIRMRAVDIVQPDIMYMGGVVRTLRVAAMAAEAGLPCVPHSANLGMVTLCTLHVMGAIPNAGPHVEYSIESTPWAEGLFRPGMPVRNGQVDIPAGPGWGVTINPDWLAQAQTQTSEV